MSVVTLKSESGLVFKVNVIPTGAVRGTYQVFRDGEVIFDSTSIGFNDGVGLFPLTDYEVIDE